jgi:hypothetical protein
MAELQAAITGGWVPVKVTDERDTAGTSWDVVTVEKDGEPRVFRSDHLAFHRYVEGLMEDFGLAYS